MSHYNLNNILLNLMAIVSFGSIFYFTIKDYLIKPNFNTKELPLQIKGIAWVLFTILAILLMCYPILVINNYELDFMFIPLVSIVAHLGLIPSILSIFVVSGFKLLSNATGYFIVPFSSEILFLAIGINFILKLKITPTKKLRYSLLFTIVVINSATVVTVKEQEVLNYLIPLYTIVIVLGGYIINKIILYMHRDRQKYIKLYENAEKDFLTGLYNTRYYNVALTEQYQKLIGNKELFSIIYIDIDDFKNINDGYGHPVGDCIIKQLSDILISSFRRNDIVARIGGDEFSILLPNCPTETAKEIAERLRISISKHNFKSEKGEILPVTVSVGLFTCDDTSKSSSEIREYVDKALYNAKKNGKNSVCIIE